jgi:phosphoribosylamine--glycine ligase
MSEVVEPTLAQMREDGNTFTGTLYAGLVLTADGLKVLEFNVRLGDPETQAVLPRMSNDLIDVLEGAAPEWSDIAAVNVVLAAQGYPTAPQKGATIKGLANVPDDVLVFHAGTARDGKKLVVDGGRVLSLVGVGPDLASARDRAYAAAEAVRWPGMQMRSDISAQA